MSDHLFVTYQLTLPAVHFTPDKLEKAARQIAVGQTIGTSQASEVAQLKPFMAEVAGIEELPDAGDGVRHARIRVAFPARVVESDLGTLLAVTFGKLSMAGAIRLVDMEIPDSLAARFGGPRHGVEGIRRLTGVPDGPLLMAIFKPCLGVPAEMLGEMLYTQAVAGVNLVKDDEVLSDTNLDTARHRLEACLKAARKAEAETGNKTLYAINLSGPAEELLDRARTLAADGATALLVNYLCYGLPLLNALRRAVDIPLVAHPSLAGAFYGSPIHGVAPCVLFGTLPRLAGADLVLFPSPYGSVALPEADAMVVSDALRQPNGGLKPSLPVPSAGIQADMVPRMIRDFGPDVVINAGTGIHDHPEGSLAGARHFVGQIRAHAPSVARMV